MTQRPSRSLQLEVQDTFGSALNNMPDNYLQCRDLKHPWKVIRDFHVVDAEKDAHVQPRLGHAVFVQRILQCARCGMKRSDAYVIATNSRWQSLERLNSTYTQPDGYSVTGVGHMSGSGDMVRGEVFRRTLGR